AGRPGAPNIQGHHDDHHIECVDADEHNLTWYLDLLDTTGSDKHFGASELWRGTCEQLPAVADRDITPALSDGLDLLPEPSIPTSYSFNFTSGTTSSPEADIFPILSTVSEDPGPQIAEHSSSASPADLPLFHTCDFCHDTFSNLGQLIDHIELKHRRGRRFYCRTCDMDFGLKKDFRRHLESAKPHQLSAIRCRCHKLFRKDKFRNHLQRKKPCDNIVHFLCFCGHSVDSNALDAVSRIVQHIGDCGRGRPGRPKK
ncbi:hypothetical protein CFAM422_010808, partial [Trichoderma lentiforme]